MRRVTIRHARTATRAHLAREPPPSTRAEPPCLARGAPSVCGLLGCFRAGVIACSVYPPNPRKFSEEIQKFEYFAADAGSSVAITTTGLRWMVKAASLMYTMKVTWFATDQLRLISELTTSADYVSDPDDVALIQYTSGSTGQPKARTPPRT